MKKFWKENSLSIIFVLLFLVCMIGQFITGLHEYNKELTELGAATIGPLSYMGSGHFLQATFENWESEFLQMALFVVLTVSLRQKGSSESKELEGKEPVDREPSTRRKNVPWPVKKGGIILRLYEHSLSISFALLFLVSIAIHFYGSLKDENSKNLMEGRGLVSWDKYISDPRFWFESFQNWQSEFLSIFTIVLFSIFLREKGSAQSKPVDAPHDETGGG